MRVCQTGISSAVAADKCGLDAALKASDRDRFRPCGIRRAGFHFPSLERSRFLRKEPARPLAEPGEDLKMQRLRLTVDEMSAGRRLTAAACRWDRRELGPLKVPLPEEKGGSHFLSDCFFTHGEDAGRCCERKLSEKSEY